MIFVTVGTAIRPFHRLLDEMEAVAPFLEEEVVAQTGPSTRPYINMKCQQYMTDEEMAHNYDHASVIVCHGGVGTIRNGLVRNIPLVIVPRKASLGETDTDHQTMVSRKVVGMGRGVCVDDIATLRDAIYCAKRLMFPPYEKSTELCDYISDLLARLATGRLHDPAPDTSK